jgi:4-amino-4-deoxy-L-arabinose transferase
MSNVIWGIAVMIICIAGYATSWKLAKKEQYTYALCCIVLCGLILRIYVGADASLHEWDERYHALVGKNLLKHWLIPTLYDNPLLDYNYKDWTTNHIWLHKQPLTLWAIALSIKLFGLHALAVRIPAIIVSTIGIKLIYDIAKTWCSTRVALLSAFLFSIHGLIIELAAGRVGTDSVDTMFLFLVLLGVWLSNRAIERKSITLHLLVGAVIGLGILTKWLPALIVIPIWLILAYPAFRPQPLKLLGYFLGILAAATVVALPWQLYILHTFPTEAGWEYAYNSQHLFKALEVHEGGFFYHFDHLRMKYGELIYLPIIWFTWYAIRSKRPPYLALLIWFWLVFLFFSIVATKMEAYTLIAAPAVFIITAVTVSHIQEHLRTSGRYKPLLIVLGLALILLPIRYSIERVKPFTVLNRNPDWNKEILSIQHSPLNSKQTVFFNCPRPIETMFFTDCIAYERSLDTIEISKLQTQGYNIQQYSK